MRRGRQKGKSTNSVASNTGREDFRKSTTPIAVICHSNWTSKTETFCSKAGRWKVIVHNPDTGKWWDRLQKSSRIRHGPPESCHAIVVYQHQDDVNNEMTQKAIKLLGERSEISSVTLLDGPPIMCEELEGADKPIFIVENQLLLCSFMELRRLWAFQDAHDVKLESTRQIEFQQVPQVCQEWSCLKWRWNGPRLKDLYQRLRYDAEEEKDCVHAEEEKAGYQGVLGYSKIFKLRRDLEEKALLLLANPETENVADFVLGGGATKNDSLFGRIHASAIASVSLTLGENARYLIVSPQRKETPTLNAYDYATASNCTKIMEQLKFVSGLELTRKEQFAIPVGSSAMTTVSLIPALFPTGIRYDRISDNFDNVLGSRRVWEEYIALKASIVYLFQGRPGPVWDLTMQVVKDALPRTWDLLMKEAPDEVFLQALLHPDVVEAGRFLRRHKESNGTITTFVPSSFDAMSRIFALARFVRTLDAPKTTLDDMAVKGAIACTMKVSQEQVEAVIQACKFGPLSVDVCENILRIEQPTTQNQQSKMSDGSDITSRVMEVLGMLGIFLNRDRKSQHDFSRFGPSCTNVKPCATTKALVDCAMYCGSIRWLSENDSEEEGIWTCQPCLHRWQKRGPREAYQTRKLMHPMTLTPFCREEYYDGKEWDNIMEATRGEISKLGKEFYWGNCSIAGCGRVCQAVARHGACSETDGVPLDDFPETVVLNDGYETVQLRRSLSPGAFGLQNIVTSDILEKYFDSEEKLMYLQGPLRRRVRNCIDKSTYILPRGLLCNKCGSIPNDAIDDYCPYCGLGFEPVFACIHYTCPQCKKHFCKACLGIDGIHYKGVYNASSHVCWRILGNRYSYHNEGFCAKCNKKRPWPKTHALVSAGPSILRKAMDWGDEGIPLANAIKMQAPNLKAFTERYRQGVDIFLNCSHTTHLGPKFCHCGDNVDANLLEDFG